jgi:AAA ATPase domain
MSKFYPKHLTEVRHDHPSGSIWWAIFIRCCWSARTSRRRLAAALRALAGGDGAVVVLKGEAGIGKTTLLRRLRGRARSAGLAVAHARGAELEREFAYGVARQLLAGGPAGGDEFNWQAAAVSSKSMSVSTTTGVRA